MADIARCLGLLSSAGELVFSNNLGSFRPEKEDRLPPSRIREMSRMAVPEDFRNKKIRRCRLITQPENTIPKPC
jgi:23S rRNA G2069 N7-methylase RlmK/C1962 C5-methylase RlmI